MDTAAFIGLGQLVISLLIWSGVDAKLLGRHLMPLMNRNKLILIFFIGGLGFSTYALYRTIVVAQASKNEISRTPVSQAMPGAAATSKDGEIAKLKQENATLRSQIATRPPNLKIHYGESEANGITLEVVVRKDGSFAMPEILIKNDGGSTAKDFLVRMFLSHPVKLPTWGLSKSTEKGFVAAFWTGGSFVSISPGDTWVGPPFAAMFTGTVPSELSARLKVFYGQARPTVADLKIVTRPE